MDKKFVIGIIAATVIIVFGFVFFQKAGSSDGKYDQFAKCLEEKGAIFYGAFWCPHCRNQKRIFGSSEQYLPYVECSTADGKGQRKICQDKNIQGYPTWEFKNGERKLEEMSLKDLSSKTRCQLPG